MFDLEQAIAEWRKQMLAAGIKAPVPLDELESHLREEVEETGAFGSERAAGVRGRRTADGASRHA